jgi:divalent metal cation (Fe/Co/Zn/Cd) transporter
LSDFENADCETAPLERSAQEIANAPKRAKLVREAFRLEWLTISWMILEAAIAIGAGVAAHSLLLIAFGIDSFIELFSASVLIWRLYVELRRGRSLSEKAERQAGRFAGGLLFALAVYVVTAAAFGLWRHQGAEFSMLGLLMAVAAIPIMYVLARRKLLLAEALRSRALRADAAEGFACSWLSLAVVVGLAAQRTVGAWWVDPVASLTIVYFLIKEAQEAWRAEDCC